MTLFGSGRLPRHSKKRSARLSALVRVSALPLVLSCGDGPTSPAGSGPIASLLIVNGQGQNGIVGRELPTPLEVKVVDAQGRPVAGQIVNFRVTSGGGSVFAGAASTSETGIAKERWTLGTSVAEDQRVEARAVDSNTGEAVVFGVFTATPEPDAGILTIAAGNSQQFEAGTPAGDSLSVRIADKYDNPVPNVNVVWTPAEGSGSVSPSSSTTTAAGFARTRWTTAPAAGTQSVSASALGAQGSPVVFTGTAGISPASIVILSGDNQSATVGTRVAVSPSVRVRDLRGNACCAGQIVTFRAGDGQGTIIGDPNAQVDASGIATVPGWILGDVPGAMKLTATLSSLPPVTFSATALAPEIRFDVQPSTAVTDAQITPAVRVSVRDATGSGIATRVSLALGANPGNGTLGGTVTADAVNGVASFSNLSVGAVGTGYTLVATSPAAGGLSVTSAPFNIDVRTNDLWTAKASLPEARARFDVGVVNGVIYAMGGLTGGTSDRRSQSLSILAYDPVTDSWSPTGSSSARFNDAIGVVNSVIYSTNGTALDAYTPATNSWATRAPLPTPVYAPGVAGLNGILYIIGRTDPAQYSPVIMQAYDPATNGWSTKSPPPMSHPEFTGKAVGLNGLLYFVDASTGITGKLLAYNPGTDSWTQRASMAIPRSEFGFASLNGKLYAVGGLIPFNHASPHDSRRRPFVEVYDPTTNAWTTVRSMSVARNGFGLAGVNGRMFAIGGDVGGANTSTDATDVNEAYTP